MTIAVLLVGCDSAEADEEDVITRVELRLQIPGTPERINASVRGDGGLTAGAVVEADTLRLEAGTIYDGRIDLFNARGETVTTQVRQEAENHQLFYTVEEADGVVVQVTDVESDYGGNDFGNDLSVGLTYQVAVTEQPSATGSIRVQVGRFAPGRKNGRTLTVEPIVDVRVPFQVGIVAPTPGPGAPEGVNRAVLMLARVDGTRTWTASAAASGGSLNLGENFTPDMTQIEGCTLFTGGGRACRDEGFLILGAGDYQGRWDLFRDADSLKAEIVDEGEWHQFFYNSSFGASGFTIQDFDRNGLPLGLSFLLSVPDNVIVGNGGFEVSLGHFDPGRAEVKTGQNVSELYDLRYRIPLKVQQNGPPETITRTTLTLQRDDAQETVTLTAVGDSLRINGAVPDSLTAEICTGPAGGQVCTSGQALTLTQGARYTGTIAVFDDVTGDNVMDELVGEDIWHQFVYLADFEVAVTTTDTDANGLPLGINFEVVVPSNSVDAALRIILDHYGRLGFKVQGRSDESDVDFSVPLVVP